MLEAVVVDSESIRSGNALEQPVRSTQAHNPIRRDLHFWQ